MNQLRGEPELQMLVKAVIKKHGKNNAPVTLRRQVKNVCDLPLKFLAPILSHITGLDESTFKNYPTQTMKEVLWLGLRCQPGTLLPRLCMPMAEVLTWVKYRYQQEGELLTPLVDMKGDVKRIEWETTLGVYAFIVPTGCMPDTPITEIHSRSRHQKVALPPEWHIKYMDVNKDVCLEKNYHDKDAYITRRSTGTSTPIHKIFELGEVKDLTLN
eukprot:1811436-Lingulodinium_polyedra.AAC.1